MLTIQIRTLETPRLRLRKLTEADVPLFYERLGGSESVTRHMLWKTHTSPAESAASIQKVLRRYETNQSWRWAIALKETDELIGIIDLLPRDMEKGIWSFAYMLAEDFWNRGYGTEALKAVLDFAFGEWNITQIQADHFARNPASGAVMRKVGMVFQEVLPQKYEKDGILQDALLYRLTREQWAASQNSPPGSDNP